MKKEIRKQLEMQMVTTDESIINPITNENIKSLIAD